VSAAEAGGAMEGAERADRHLVFIVGPPAVGKMAVGMELERLTGMPLFHNHLTIDLVLRFFPFSSAPFRRLVGEFRTRICEEVADSELPGLIFTYVWAFDLPADREFVDHLAGIFQSRGAGVCYVELEAPLEERLRRNETELRLAEKRPKRDLERSRRNLLELEEGYRMNSAPLEFPYPDRYLRIDNTEIPPAEVARRIAEAFDLPRAESAPADG
jgi:hypothetical protein